MPLPELIEIVPFSKEQLRSFQWKKAEIMVPGSKSSWVKFDFGKIGAKSFLMDVFFFFGFGVLGVMDGNIVGESLAKKTDGCVCACVSASFD